MKILPTRFSDVMLIEPVTRSDERGFFLETYRRESYATVGVDVEFVQDNHSRSVRGSLRGLHFQSMPGQAKLVRVARGRIWDAVVDLRRTSPTFGQWEGFVLDDVTHRQLYVPIGFAHGFCVLSEVADVAYKVTSYYEPKAERGLAWDDPALAIQWPIATPTLSIRDRSHPTLSELERALPNW
jgi:dTDP-4-dehydrorhamnose 3,5-epimerase